MKIRTNIYLEKYHIEFLEKMTAYLNTKGISKWSHSRVIRRALDEYIRRHKRK